MTGRCRLKSYITLCRCPPSNYSGRMKYRHVCCRIIGDGSGSDWNKRLRTIGYELDRADGRKTCRHSRLGPFSMVYVADKALK
ncbi:hypothetical protein M0R45_024961 [Rubus argutus]|uniref:Uncharacterized protein n=1 Tax=Rubus argutus TaxID=59490 RepID=A0AAW1WWV6_RUBAR